MKKFKKVFKKIRVYFSIIAISLASLIFIYLAFLYYYQGKFFPGVVIANMDIGGKNANFAKTNFQSEFNKRKTNSLELTYENQTFTINPKNLNAQLNLDEILNKAYRIGRSGNLILDLYDQARGIIFKTYFSFTLKYNKDNLNTQIININEKVKKEAVPADILIEEEVEVIPSQNGLALDDKLLTAQIESYLSLSSPPPKAITVKTITPTLTTNKANQFKTALDSIKTTPLKLNFKDKTWEINQAVLYSLLNFNPNQNSKNDILDKVESYNYFKNIAQEINQPLKEAVFIFDENTKRVKEFAPGQEGRELDIKLAQNLIENAVLKGHMDSVNLPVNITYPKTTAGDVNDYGIRELLGEGTSSFIDSIPNRVFNIGLASSRTQGILIPPGETFSFNSAVGEISAATGFKQAYVIKEGKTVLDDGGGVCQVSTTLYRAVLNAGLPVIERTAHAYRVGFYEQGGSPPGFDATVFPPSVDFKFKNDTPAYILIQNKIVGTTLTFQIYGTSDGRVTTISKPVILSTTPPPPELRIDDPTLPKGVEKEVEHAITGMNIQFKRTVTRNGEILIDETVRSNFRPWQKVIMVGTKEN